MNKLIKYALLGAFCVSVAHAGDVFVKNGTNWNVELLYKVSALGGRPLPPRDYFVRILAPGEFANLGDSDPIVDIKFKTYGKTAGTWAREHSIDIAAFKKLKNDKPVTYLIGVTPWQQWEVTTIIGREEKILDNTIEAIGDSEWQFAKSFPRAWAKQQEFMALPAEKREGDPWNVRHILGLPEEGVTKQDLQEAYRDVRAQWEDALKRAPTSLIKNRITQILKVIDEQYKNVKNLV